MFCSVLFCSVLFVSYLLPISPLSTPLCTHRLLLGSLMRAYLCAMYAYASRAARKELKIIIIQHLLISSRIIMQYYYRLSIGHYSANLQKISHLANKIPIKIGY